MSVSLTVKNSHETITHEIITGTWNNNGNHMKQKQEPNK